MTLHHVIRDAMEEAGLEPVEFEKPLKSVSAMVKLSKEIRPRHFVECHQAVGWALGNLIDLFGKNLYDIKSLTMQNEGDKVTVEAIVCISGATFEDDHVSWLDGTILGHYVGKDLPSHGWAWERMCWRWDKAERIGPVTGFTQMAGDGEATGALDESVDTTF